MKVSKIEDIDGIYHVTITPTWIERIFGLKEKVMKFKPKGATFVFGGGEVYIRSDGEETGNGSYIGEALDKFRKRF